MLAVAVVWAPFPGARADREFPPVPLPSHPSDVAWPRSSWPEADLPAAVDRRALAAAVSALFAATGRGGLADTRALLVVHRGSIVFERYSEEFGRDSRFQSWSMAKSLTNALVGILVRDGKLDIDAPAPVAAWRSPGDPRGAITLRHMLHMSSGLANEDEGTRPDGFVARTLFGDRVHDMAAFNADVPLAHEPGTHWAYSTGTSILIASIAGQAIGSTREAIRAYMRRELFDPLGMKSAMPEFDEAGSFVGGAHFHATARDYARFGLLYLRDGVFDGRRILPAGWVDFSRTPAPAANNGNYAGHFWLSLPPGPDQFPSLTDAPDGTFSANGNEGQFIAIVPSHDLVVVRLGALHRTSWASLSDHLEEVLHAFPLRAQKAAVGSSL